MEQIYKREKKIHKCFADLKNVFKFEATKEQTKNKIMAWELRTEF
jgi:hypothetical protein